MKFQNENIFSALAKYNAAKDENYLTEAFVFIINSLLCRECSVGCEILTKLCVENNEFTFDVDEDISVTTQETTEQGRPDIKVSTPDKLIYVEVKHDSPYYPEQVSRYRKALQSSNATIKHVVLLTRFAIDFTQLKTKPYKHVRWFEVYNWLESARIRDPINVYLVKSFNSFLEEKQMSIQKVEWEYINGVPAMMNLLNMIEVAIQSAGLQLYPSYPRAVALESRGFYIETNKVWCGIYYSDPLNVGFYLYEKTKYDKKRLQKPTYRMSEDRWSISLWLPLEEYHFFSLNKNEQLELITKFVKIANTEAKQMRVDNK